MSFIAPPARSKITNQIYKSFEVILKSDLGDETYKGAFVFTIKVREELVDTRLRDQVVFRERKALRIKCRRLNTSQGGSIPRSCSVWLAATHNTTNKLQ